jgi:uncharacterized protein YjiS (DUF1127 family)
MRSDDLYQPRTVPETETPQAMARGTRRWPNYRSEVAALTEQSQGAFYD